MMRKMRCVLGVMKTRYVEKAEFGFSGVNSYAGKSYPVIGAFFGAKTSPSSTPKAPSIFSAPIAVQAKTERLSVRRDIFMVAPRLLNSVELTGPGPRTQHRVEFDQVETVKTPRVTLRGHRSHIIS